MAKFALKLPSSKVDISLTPGSIEPAMKAADAKSSKLFNVPIGSIKLIPGFNVRVQSPEYLAHRDALVQSIKANGYDSTRPIAGYVAKEGEANVIYVTDGYTRLDAVNTFNADPDTAQENEIATLPVIIRSPAPSLADLTVALHTSNNGRPLTPFEMGVVVKRLLRDVPEKQVAKQKSEIAGRLAVTSRWIDDVLLLVNGPKEVREAVLSGDVSSTLAIQELRKSPEGAIEKIQAAVAKVKANGGKKVTKKALGPKLVKHKHVVSIAAGTDMKDIVKAVAAHVRAHVSSVPHATDPEAKVADTDGTITLTIEVPAVEEAPAPKAAAKKAKAKGKKPVAKKANGKDLGIEGAEEVASEQIDDEPARIPPAVKSDKALEEVDI